MFYTKHKTYRFGSELDLSQTILETLVSHFMLKNLKKPETILKGRTLVKEINLDGSGPLIIKQYFRGGFISRFNKQWYLFSSKKRGEAEFDFLTRAQKAGVAVPKPLIYASKGCLFYKAWLITKKIEGSENFAGLCLKDEEMAVSLLPSISKNISILIENSIHHTDLHPGNVIVDNNNKPFILDFDKACYFAGNKKKLKEKYKQRWQRAIKKYKLSKSLSDLDL